MVSRSSIPLEGDSRSESSEADNGPKSSRKEIRNHHPEDINMQLFSAVQAGHYIAIIAAAITMAFFSTLFRASVAPPCEPCVAAETYMRNIKDRTVSPCDNFYQHVCGKWTDTGTESIVGDLRKRGAAALEAALSSYPNHSDTASWTYQMLASLYKSCREELSHKRNVSYVAKKFSDVSGLSWKQFASIGDAEAFVDIIGQMTIKLDLNPFFTIDPSRYGNGLTIKPVAGRNVLDVATAKKLIAVAVSLNRIPEEAVVVENVLGLAKKIEERYTLSEMGFRVHYAREAFEELGIGAWETWMTVVNRYTPRWVNISAMSQVILYSPTMLRNLLEHAFHADPKARSLYLFLHFLKAVVAVVEISGQRDAALKTCFRHVEREEFFAVRHDFALYTLADLNTLREIKQMFAKLILHAMRSVKSNTHLNDVIKKALNSELHSVSFSSFSTSLYPGTEELSEIYAAFPHNLSIYHTRLKLGSTFNIKHRAELWGLSRCLDDDHPFLNLRSKLCFSPYIVLPPMFYPGADDSLNYGALGFLMAWQLLRKVFNAVRREGSDKEQSAVKSFIRRAAPCYEKHSNGTNDQRTLDAATTSLGLRVAFESYRGGPRQRGKLYNHKAFFTRACLPLCSAHPSVEPRYGADLPPWRVCNGAVRSMPEFFAAFKCPVISEMSSGGICTLL